MEEISNEDNSDTPLPSQELLRMSLKVPMTKIKKVKMKNDKPKYGLHRCEVCNKICNNKAALVSHKAIHVDTKEFECLKCPYKGKTRKYLSCHTLKVHTKPSKYTCEHCGKKFHFMNRLESHKRVHTGEKPYKCVHCDKAFSAKYSLDTHLLLHSDEKPYKCSFCEYACRDSSTLRKHQNRHMGLETVYQCKKCDMCFKQKYLLKTHVAEIHLKLDVKKYICAKCGKEYKNRTPLTRHINTIHSEIMKTECKLCGIFLNSKYNLKRHMLIHTEARPYKCQFEGCGKGFKDPSTMAKHNIIHYPSKHMACKVCGKLFTRIRRLERHMAQHKAKKRTVECEYCGVRFYNDVYLKLHHKRKHDKKRKRYKCDLCDFFTSNKPSIVMHLKYGHAKDNDVDCKICNIRFKKQEYLKIHFTRKHKRRYKPMKRLKKKPKKTQIIIKEEPKDSTDEKEVMELLTDIKRETEEQRIEDSDTIMYSDAVFSEDVAESYIKHNSEKLTRLPEDVFDTFFIEHVYRRYLEKKERPTIIDKEEEEKGIRRYKELLSEIIGGNEMDISEALREREIEDKNQDAKRNAKKRKIKKTKKRSKTISKNVKEESILDEDNTPSRDDMNTTGVQEQNRVSEELNPISKIKFNMHQCYVCFQVFETKKSLTKHCAQHFDVCNETQLKKCPLCTYVTKGSNFSLHMRRVHKMQISYNSSTIQENVNGAKYSFKGNNGYDIEIIPSIKNLNKRESMRIDKRNRIMKDRSVTKTKLVKSGNEWIVQKQNLSTEDFIMPELDKSDDYLETLRQKYREYKSNGQRMLFPCQFCDKLCQSFSALKLHLRRHDNNPKPFKKKVWKHKLKDLVKDDLVTIESSKGSNKDTFLIEKSTKHVLIDGKCLKVILKDCMKDNSCIEKESSLYLQKCSERDTKNSLYSQKCSESEAKKTLYLQKCSEQDTKNSLHSQKCSESEAKKTLYLQKSSEQELMKALYLQKNSEREVESVFALPSSTSTKRPRSKETRDPLADPKPVTSRHKCDKALIEFYKANIKGSDIEFWQFLKIFNRMSRENIEDFKDLEGRYDFGMHIDNRIRKKDENDRESLENSTSCS